MLPGFRPMMKTRGVDNMPVHAMALLWNGQALAASQEANAFPLSRSRTGLGFNVAIGPVQFHAHGQA